MTLLHYMTWALNANSLFVNKPVAEIDKYWFKHV